MFEKQQIRFARALDKDARIAKIHAHIGVGAQHHVASYRFAYGDGCISLINRILDTHFQLEEGVTFLDLLVCLGDIVFNLGVAQEIHRGDRVAHRAAVHIRQRHLEMPPHQIRDRCVHRTLGAAVVMQRMCAEVCEFSAL